MSRKRVPREWLWVVILAIVILFTCLLTGCGISDTGTSPDTKDEAEVEKIKGTLALYKMSFEGHDYIVFNQVDIIHSASCRGRH